MAIRSWDAARNWLAADGQARWPPLLDHDGPTVKSVSDNPS